VKDLAGADEAALGATIAAQGWTRAPSLPLAVLDLPFRDAKTYVASLSAATRKDIRRKLRDAGAMRIEWRGDLGGRDDEVAALYESTRAHSELDYGDLETLPNGYFAAVLRALDGRARIAFYFAGDELCAF